MINEMDQPAALLDCGLMTRVHALIDTDGTTLGRDVIDHSAMPAQDEMLLFPF